MTAWIHEAVLRSAALFVPDSLRADWLAEWRSELWHVHAAPGTTRATAFCLGAFPDALWLWRNAPRRGIREIINLNSPTRCLGFLAVLAAVSLLFAYQIPDAPPIPKRTSDHLFLWLLVLACAMLTGPTSLCLADYRANRGVLSRSTRLKRWLFLAAKIVFILLASDDAMRYVAYALNADPRSRSAGLVIQLAVWGMPFALRWSLRDQCRRCPVCLRALSNPVRVGAPAGYFLEWNCTELICLRGHGMLYVPECHTSWFNAPRWFYMEPPIESVTDLDALARRTHV